MDTHTCINADLSTEGHSGLDVMCDISTKPRAELSLSDNEEPPEDFSFGDARQQVMMEEEHVKQHLARYVHITTA